MNINKFCRFCLKEVFGTRFENIEGNVRNMSSVLKLDMDLDISEEPILCIDCVKNLQRLYSFKLICINTENRLSPFTKGHNHQQFDMPHVYLRIYENKSLGEQNICRFCMRKILSDVSIQLDTVINAMPSIKELLDGFLPEVDITLVRDPIICKTCHNFLLDYLIFTKNCVSIEASITKCIETEGIRPEEKIDLKNVQEFLDKEVIKKEINEMDVVKREVHQDVEFLENSSFNMDVGSESCLPTEDSKLDIKYENLRPIINAVNATERAVECTSLTVENIIKQEGGEFNKIKNIEQLCESPALYSCSECNLEVESKEDDKHLYIHENQYAIMESMHNLIHKYSSEVIYKYKDEDCSYDTKRKGDLVSHGFNHKDLLEITTYKCRYDGCSFETKVKYNLSIHELVHKDFSDVTTYKCENEHCSFETKYKSSLNSHMLIHKDLSEVTMYKCENENCSFETKRKSCLRNHNLIHKDSSEVTIYKCRIEGCSYETRRKGGLTRHKLVHQDFSDVVTYKCKYEGCSYKTKHKANLLCHGLLHKEITMYKCGIEGCFYETKYKKKLMLHKKRVHKQPSEGTARKRKNGDMQDKRYCIVN